MHGSSWHPSAAATYGSLVTKLTAAGETDRSISISLNDDRTQTLSYNDCSQTKTS